MEAPPCHIKERKLHVKTSAKRNQDLDKGDIIGGGDLYIFLYFSQVNAVHILGELPYLNQVI